MFSWRLLWQEQPQKPQFQRLKEIETQVEICSSAISTHTAYNQLETLKLRTPRAQRLIAAPYATPQIPV